MGACCRRSDRNEPLDQKEANLDEPGLKVPQEEIEEHGAKPESKDEPQENLDEQKFRENVVNIKSANQNTNVKTAFSFIAGSREAW